MANIRNCVATTIKGCGVGITETKEGRSRSGDWYANFLLRTDDGNILRLQFWSEDKESIDRLFLSGTPKGGRVGFRGCLSGTYDEKPTVVCSQEDIKTEGMD